MKNKIFQTLYFAVRTNRVERSAFKLDFANYDARYYQQARLANMFGGPDCVLYGNSNIEFQNAYKYMSEYPMLTLNCGLAGATGTDLWDYLARRDGVKLREILKEKKNPMEVLNAFGNHILQRKMGSADTAIFRLKSIMPYSYCVGIPPIHSSLIEAQAKMLGVKIDKKEIDDDVKLLNSKLKSAWRERFIDMYSLFIDHRTGEAVPGVLEDAVHYSNAVKRLYIKMISAIYAQAKK